MKKIYNGTDSSITVIVGGNDIYIPMYGFADAEIPEGAVFNNPDGSFYVEDEGNFYAKTENCHTVADIEIYAE